MRLMDKRQALELRRKGFSYSEIRKRIPNLSKGTLSGWVKSIELSEKQKEEILRKAKKAVDKGRLKGSWANRVKWQARINLINEVAKKEFPALARNHLFLIGLTLYWAEGSKTNRRFQFINSDPEIIRVMMRWLREVMSVAEDQFLVRLYIHEIYKSENCEKYWSNITGIPVSKFKKTVFKPTPHLVRKNLSYKGCCRIELRGSDLFWKTLAWQRMLTTI